MGDQDMPECVFRMFQVWWTAPLLSLSAHLPALVIKHWSQALVMVDKGKWNLSAWFRDYEDLVWNDDFIFAVL